MINFSNLKSLADHLKCLLVKNTKEQSSAINCLRIEQISAKETKFTSYEPNVGYFERIILETSPDLRSDVGDVYLVDAVEFINIVNTFSKTHCQYLNIREEEGMLAYYDSYHLDYNGVPQYKSRDYISLYPGDYTDYQPPSLSDYTQIGYCTAESFDHLVKIVTSNGQYSDANEDYLATVNDAGRSIMLITKLDSLELFATSRNLSVLFTVKLDASFTKEEQLYIEGRHFNRLQYFSEGEAIEVYSCMMTKTLGDEEYYYPWVVFKSSRNILACRLLDSNESLLVYYNNFQSTQDLNFTTRELNRYSLMDAFVRLKQKSNLGQLYLLFIEDDESEPPKFIIKDANSFLAPAEYKVDITYTDSSPFLTFAYTVDELESILNLLRIYEDETVKTKHPIMAIDLGILIRTINDIDYPLLITYIYPVQARDKILLMAQPDDGLKYIAPANDVTYEQTMEAP